MLGTEPSDGPRAERPIYVTALERLAGCPWQAFLERVLCLEPVPDPLAGLPGITPLLVGALCHQVLEDIVRRGLSDPPADLEPARRRIPQAVAWPAARELAAIVRRAAEALCHHEGIGVPGFAAVLARTAAPFLDQAQRLDWPTDGGLHVLGAEIEGALELVDLTGRSRPIRFRADRLDLDDRGLALTDYKTGARAVSDLKTAPGRRKHLLRSVASGQRLQAVAYALAGGEAGDSGRYLFLHPDLGEDRAVREVRVAADDEELAGAFRLAAGAALAAWDAGIFFPRVLSPDKDEEPARCEYCAVREACSRGDSGARRRLRQWMDARWAELGRGATLGPAQLIALTLWRLPSSEDT
jgi:hypothetical protein